MSDTEKMCSPRTALLTYRWALRYPGPAASFPYGGMENRAHVCHTDNFGRRQEPGLAVAHSWPLVVRQFGYQCDLA